MSRKFERALVLVKHGLSNFPSVQSQNILKFNQGLIHLMLASYDSCIESLLEVIQAFDMGLVPANDIFLRYTLQNLVIAVGLRARGGFGELLEVIKSQKMLGLTYTDDMNIVNF